MSKKKYWEIHSSWEKAEESWDKQASKAAKEHPLKLLKTLPKMDGITADTAKNLKWKALKYMVREDKNAAIRQHFLKHPIRYGLAFLRSLFKRESFSREGDFFFYGLKNLNDFEAQLKEDKTLFVLGFSYCHKPFECPSQRFSNQCIHDATHPVCQQCFIGKSLNTLPEGKAIPLIIPTIHYIGEKIFEIVHTHPDKKVLFLITACEMTLKMFSDWGNMAGVKGIGIRLDGRICNTMKAFELSEKGIKPGLTVVLDETQKMIINILKLQNSTISKS